MQKSFSKRSGGFKSTRSTFFITAVIIALITVLCYTGLYIPGVIQIKGIQEIRLGIDINGGFEGVLKAASSYQGTPTDAELQAAKTVVELRLDNLNITDREVYLDSLKRIVVRVPWKSDDASNDATEAIKELGQMALLTFKDPDGGVILTGSDVKDAYAAVSQKDSSPIVVLVLTDEGKTKFAAATKRLIGQDISINMDDVEKSSPTVEDVITGGEAIISGIGTTDDAKLLAGTIKAGALPFALEAVSTNEISASLGRDSLDKMIDAGALAFLLICLFLLLFYRLPGFVAIIALLAQLVGQLLAISVPQFTLTLPGIAAIILSIGMGVDANIIITERIKEEVNAGNPLKVAIRNGFDRAFSAVLDGNITVAIVAILLMIFGSGSFLSFGYSLLTGVILNGLCGVTATRLMIGSLSQYPKFQSKWLYGGKKQLPDDGKKVKG